MKISRNRCFSTPPALGWSASCALPIESSWHRRLTAADFTSIATATLNRSRHRRRRLGIAAAAAAAATPTAEITTTIATSSAAAAVATSMAIDTAYTKYVRYIELFLWEPEYRLMVLTNVFTIEY